MHLHILKKMERNVKEYSSHILRYMNIYEYMQYIYMICHQQAKYDL